MKYILRILLANHLSAEEHSLQWRRHTTKAKGAWHELLVWAMSSTEGKDVKDSWNGLLGFVLGYPLLTSPWFLLYLQIWATT